MSDKKKAVSIFTDGGCRGNPGPGAWAAILRHAAGEKEISGYQADTTNNRMELTAAIRALEELKQPCRVEFFTDSEYLRKGITEWIDNWKRRGWRTASKKPVKNQDLWQRLDDLADGHEVDWKWVRGHSGHTENERCDELVNEELDRNGA